MSFMKVKTLSKSADYIPLPNVTSDNTVIALPIEYGPQP